jgi:hypothetical protein
MRTILNWLDSPSGAKIPLVLSKILVGLTIALNTVLLLTVYAYYTDSYSFNTPDPELAVVTLVLLGMVATLGTYILLDVSKKQYQEAVDRVKNK